MGLAQVLSRTRRGLEAPLVSVEVHLGAGLPCFSIVGLPAPVVRESRERVRAALATAGFDFPAGRITVNLAPVELAKEGGRFDLPIALGVLLASQQLKPKRKRAFECYGELGLSGELKPVSGLFLPAVYAERAGHELLVPAGNVEEARLAGVTQCVGFRHLTEVCDYLRSVAASPPKANDGHAHAAEPHLATAAPNSAGSAPLSLDEVRGQANAKRALLVAAAGGHSILLFGPPGSGKSMLAARLPDLLPPLSRVEALEVASIASIASGVPTAAWMQRPFRAPHHSASANAIVGGGPRLTPGEISLAHHGVLFLDELPEFDRRVLESLREPMETGVMHLARASGRISLPARFLLVAAMNPCACGYYGDAERRCQCGAREVQRYRARISGPLLDRIDLRVEVQRPTAGELLSEGGEACSDPLLADPVGAVLRARERQLTRSGLLNANFGTRELQQHCAIDAPSKQLMEKAKQRLGLSARAIHRCLRVARTLADLSAARDIDAGHVAEALQWRREI